jgi:DNA-binding HxlR family transcriptional regulator
MGADQRRSGCPVNLTLEAPGDDWRLLVLRDLTFGNRRRFCVLPEFRRQVLKREMAR